MIKRYSAWIALFLFCSVATSAPTFARSPFTTLGFRDHRQFVLRCAAHYECDIQLQPGERVNDGFNAHIQDWDPHIGYNGEGRVTPHLVLRPSKSDLRTNIILTTTKRTYYILAVSTNSDTPSYYSFYYPQDVYRELARRSAALQSALRAQRAQASPSPTATPANVASLSSVCFDFDYSYQIDRNVQSDHIPGSKPSSEQLPAYLTPRIVCSDGRHTYIDFPRPREVPSDLPISLAVTSEGDTLINYTYVADLNRFTVDGVYDSFVLELGSQTRPLRLRIYHGKAAPQAGRHSATPTPIVTPAATALASPVPSATPASVKQ